MLQGFHEISLKYSYLIKGGLIPESFSCWLQSPIKCGKHYPEHLFFIYVDRAQDSDLTHFLGDWSQSENIL